MSELVARTGRLHQRYEAGCRLVAGCIPFKYRSPAETSDGGSQKILEVLMISSASGHGLVFPKGGWENDETVEEAAAREAVEEAGVRGELLSCVFTDNDIRIWLKIAQIRYASQGIIGVIEASADYEEFLGYYEFKSKTLQDDCCPEGICKAAMFALLVKEELQFWPEQSTRKRSWLTIPEAVHSCRHQWMRNALENSFLKWHEEQMVNTSKKENHLILPASLPN
ncbi:nudix hydrolase 16, mitochondrial [Senna tora]|uniref:Nudix hydrolase 16, mitochondrial n=1 Tax=Senna tora TaxID=362788 RepID=A0A834SH87_9FABA|nr:nudix hydrolase 16, mitochondrial [Senna tora]